MPSRIALLSVTSNAILLLLKLFAGLLTGSLSIISEAIDSGVDLFASMITWFSLRESEKPADKKHPYGHGKWENLSATTEAGLILFAGVFIIVQAINRLIKGRMLANVNIGLIVMAISVTTNFFLSRYIMRAAERYDSIALEADAWHLKVNVFQGGAVVLGLVYIELTGFTTIDPLIAIGLAVYIIINGYKIVRRSVSALIDERLPRDEEAKIMVIINSHNKEFGNLIGFHKLRTRKSGSERHIDLHLLFHKDEKIKNAHDICNHLEKDIKKVLPRSHIIIHVEPHEVE